MPEPLKKVHLDPVFWPRWILGCGIQKQVRRDGKQMPITSAREEVTCLMCRKIMRRIADQWVNDVTLRKDQTNDDET